MYETTKTKIKILKLVVSYFWKVFHKNISTIELIEFFAYPSLP